MRPWEHPGGAEHRRVRAAPPDGQPGRGYYETGESQRAADAPENGARFEEYRPKLRPLVDGETVLFGEAVPFAAPGFEA